MKRRTVTAFPLALLALSGVAASDQPHGTWKDAKVTEITVYTTGGTDGKGYMVVRFAANGTGTPGCASGYPRSVAIDMSTVGGAMAAEMAEKSSLIGSVLTVTGTGACNVSPKIETLASVQETAEQGPERVSGGLQPSQPSH